MAKSFYLMFISFIVFGQQNFSIISKRRIGVRDTFINTSSGCCAINSTRCKSHRQFWCGKINYSNCNLLIWILNLDEDGKVATTTWDYFVFQFSFIAFGERLGKYDFGFAYLEFFNTYYEFARPELRTSGNYSGIIINFHRSILVVGL